MIRYESSGFAGVIRAIESLEVEDEGENRVDVNDGDIVVSFRVNDTWIVYVGQLERMTYLRYWSHGEFSRVNEALKNAGYGRYDVVWRKHSYIYTKTCTAIAGEWLLRKLGIPYASYHPSLWNRELAIEYTRWRW